MRNEIKIDVRRMSNFGVDNGAGLDVAISVIGIFRVGGKQSNVMTFLDNEESYFWLVSRVSSEFATSIANGLKFVMHYLRKLTFAHTVSVFRTRKRIR